MVDLHTIEWMSHKPEEFHKADFDNIPPSIEHRRPLLRSVHID